METELARITQRAHEHPKEKFNSLMGRVFNLERLHESFQAQSRRKAAGIDGVRKDDYAVGGEDKLRELSERIRRMGYRPAAVRRVYIPKVTGGERPLGIPTFEDRLVQDRVAKVLAAIWEAEFCHSSFGYRPGRSAHDALLALHQVITQCGTQFVVEADIKGFFSAVSHEHLMRFLEHRISDPNFLRLIRRYLKAGVMEDGMFSASNEGTPQGGLVSPVLSNIYLHYVLDLWFDKRFARTCRGTARLIRFADDFVACFQYQEDAERYYTAVQERLNAFALEIEPSKTKLLPFGMRHAPEETETFTFLGFTHYVTRSLKGRTKIGRNTAGKKFRKKLQEVRATLRGKRTAGTKAMVMYAKQQLQGHINYYGVSENMRSLSNYCYQVQRLLYKWLNRRSNKRSCDWATFRAWYDRLGMPRPRIVHSFYTRT